MISSNIILPLITIALLVGFTIFLKPEIIKEKSKQLKIMVFVLILIGIIAAISAVNSYQGKLLEAEIEENRKSTVKSNLLVDSIQSDIDSIITRNNLKEAYDTVNTADIKKKLIRDSVNVLEDSVADSAVDSVDNRMEEDSVNVSQDSTILDSNDSVFSSMNPRMDSLSLEIKNIETRINQLRADETRKQQLINKLKKEINIKENELIKGSKSELYGSRLKSAENDLKRLHDQIRKLEIRKERLISATRQVLRQEKK